jgi:hypothetical protein
VRVAALLAAPGAPEPAVVPLLRALAPHGIEVVLGPPATPVDLALATHWTAVPALAAAPARALARWLEDLGDRHLAPGDPRRAAASRADDVPLPTVAAARWLVELLATLHPNLACREVLPGLGAAPLPAPPPHDGPMRVLAADAEAARIAAGMREPGAVRLAPGRLEDADVVLDLSARAAPPGLALEGMTRGAAAVVTPAPGREEQVHHGRDGLLVAWDDARGTARALDLLARDRALLAELRAGALATARAWPTREQSAADLAGALRGLAAEPASPALREALAALAPSARERPRLRGLGRYTGGSPRRLAGRSRRRPA